jgi:hypothetical protein
MMKRLRRKPERPQIQVSFKLYGFQCDPSEITDLLGMQPDRVLRAGEALETPGTQGRVISKFNQWVLHAPISNSPMLEDHIEPLVTRLEPIAVELGQLPSDADREISIAVYITDTESIPGMHLERALIERIASLGLAIDLSIY